MGRPEQSLVELPPDWNREPVAPDSGFAELLRAVNEAAATVVTILPDGNWEYVRLHNTSDGAAPLNFDTKSRPSGETMEIQLGRLMRELAELSKLAKGYVEKLLKAFPPEEMRFTDCQYGIQYKRTIDRSVFVPEESSSDFEGEVRAKIIEIFSLVYKINGKILGISQSFSHIKGSKGKKEAVLSISLV